MLNMLLFAENSIFQNNISTNLLSCSLLLKAISQCALANNVEHFKMVLESVSCTEEDLLFTDAETGSFVTSLLFACWKCPMYTNIEGSILSI